MGNYLIMSYISYEKSKLVNLEFALNKEVLRSNQSGAFCATTIIGCNTRKYHGLLVVQQPELDNNNHVLLSGVDETLIHGSEEFHLGVHMYPNGVYEPKGHKYIRNFTADPMPKLTYRIGNIVLVKEIIFSDSEARVFVRYTLEDAADPITLRVIPFLAFRNVHMLTHENYEASRKAEPLKNGASWCLYNGYSPLCMQFSRSVEYTHVPHWYYNMFYVREQERGYDAMEDQFVPGFFELNMKKGDTVIMAAGLDEMTPATIKRRCEAEEKKLLPQHNYEDCLVKASQQFIIRKNDKETRLWAGFPWFGSCSRDMFLALPGIALALNDEKTFTNSLNYLISRMRGPFFPHRYYQKSLYYTAVDSPLWFVWLLQKYDTMLGVDKATIWKRYGKTIETIITEFIKGTEFNVRMTDNGLLYAGTPNVALTWMNVFADGTPWTPRNGYAIEVNALWYNALRYAVDLVRAASPTNGHADEWTKIADNIKLNYSKMFITGKGDFVDYANEQGCNTMVRPNMTIAASLPYAPFDEEEGKRIFDMTKSDLLTPRGLRSLSPKDDEYQGHTIGNHSKRERAYHNGTAFPWLLMPYADLMIKLYGKSAVSEIEDLYLGFEPAIKDNGLGSISEIYDGDPAFEGRGCISQSTSIGMLLYLKYLIEKLNNKEGAK